MPNHVVNVLQINGTPEQVQLVRETIRGDEDADGRNAPRLVDFEKIVPMPESLDIKDGIEAMAVRYETEGARHPSDDLHERPGFDQVIYEQCLENVRLHGHATWHGWCRANWGTKWNAYTQVEREPHIIEFQTAWNMPHKFMQMLAARFPEVEFVVKFADEDIGRNCGIATYRGGVLASLEDPDDPTAFAYELHRYSAEAIAEREAEIEADRVETARRAGR